MIAKTTITADTPGIFDQRRMGLRKLIQCFGDNCDYSLTGRRAARFGALSHLRQAIVRKVVRKSRHGKIL